MTKSTELERKIIGETWTSPDIYANVEQLCDFGSRFSGTESERQARDFIRDRFEEYGLKNVRLVTFDYLGWTRGEASLCTIKPSQKNLASAISLVYSPNTLADGLRAEVVGVGMGTKAEFAAKKDEIAGKFAALAEGIATPADVERMRAAVNRTEEYDDIRELMTDLVVKND